MDGDGALHSLNRMSKFHVASNSSALIRSGKSVGNPHKESRPPTLKSRAYRVVRDSKYVGIDLVNSESRKRKSGAIPLRLGTRASKRSTAEACDVKGDGCLHEIAADVSVSDSTPNALNPCPSKGLEVKASSKVFMQDGLFVALVGGDLDLKFKDGDIPIQAKKEDICFSAKQGSTAEEETDNATTYEKGAEQLNGKVRVSLLSPLSHENSTTVVGGEQGASKQKNSTVVGGSGQGTSDQRVLRPRRTAQQNKKAVKQRRPLQDVTLCSADVERIVRRRIKVFWPLDGKWYFGVVKEYDAVRKQHRIVYDDHDEEWLSLRKEKFKLQVVPGEVFGHPNAAKKLSFSVAEGESLGSRRKVERGLAERRTGVAARLQGGTSFRGDLFLEFDEPSVSLMKGSEHGKESKRLKEMNKAKFFSNTGFNSPTMEPPWNGSEPGITTQVDEGGGSTTGKLERQVAHIKAAADSMRQSGGKYVASSVDDINFSSAKANSGIAMPCKCVYVRRHSHRRDSNRPSVELDGFLYRGESRKLTGSLHPELKMIQNLGEAGALEKQGNAEEMHVGSVGSLLNSTYCEGTENIDSSGRRVWNPISEENVRELPEAIMAGQHQQVVDSRELESYRDPMGLDLNKPTTCQENRMSLEIVPFISKQPKHGCYKEDTQHREQQEQEVPSDTRILRRRIASMDFVRSATATGRGLYFSDSSSSGFQQVVSHVGLPYLRREIPYNDWRMFLGSLLHLPHSDAALLGKFLIAMKRSGIFSHASLLNMVTNPGLFLNAMNVLLSGEGSSRQGGHLQYWLRKDIVDIKPGFWSTYTLLPTKHNMENGSSTSLILPQNVVDILAHLLCNPSVVASLSECCLEDGALLWRRLFGSRRNGDLECSALLQRTLKSDLADASLIATDSVQSTEGTSWTSTEVEAEKGSQTGNSLNGLLEIMVPQDAFSPSMLQVVPGHCNSSPVSNTGSCIQTHALMEGPAASAEKVVISLEQNGSSFTRAPGVDILTEGGVAVSKKDAGFPENGGSLLKEPGSNKKDLRALKRLKRSLSEREVAATEQDEFIEDLGMGDITCPHLAKKVKGGLDNKDCLVTSFQLSECSPLTMTASQDPSALPGLQIPAMPETLLKFRRYPCNKGVWSVSGNPMETHQVELGSFGPVKDEMDPRFSQSPVESHRGLTKYSHTHKYLKYRMTKEQNHESQSLDSLSHQTTSASPDYGGVDFGIQANVGRLYDLETKKPWIDSRVPFFYNGTLDSKKRKRGLSSVHRDYAATSHLQSKRRGRPSRQSKNDLNLVSTSSCCIANLLLTKLDRCWRELHTTVELQVFNDNEWMIAVKSASGNLYTHKVLQNSPTGTTNRCTHAMMWRGGDGWILEFSDRKQWNAFKGLYEECSFRNARAASLKDIPIPGVKQIEDPDVMLPDTLFSRPHSSYICRPEGEVDVALSGSRVVYDMDSEDEVWLDCVKVERSNVGDSMSKTWISEETLEKIIDKLEKASFVGRHDPVSEDMAVELCHGMGSVDAIKAIHSYWLHKRQKKGMALVRQFQLAPWERYQKQLLDWQARVDEHQLPNQQLPQGHVRPPMFAFCLPPRGLELANNKNKLQKQRSQRKISSGCRVFWQGDVPTCEVSTNTNIIQQDRRGLIDMMNGQRAFTGIKPAEETSPESSPINLFDSSVDTQTCSSGSTGITLLEQPESSDWPFASSHISSHKKIGRKARVQTIVSTEEFRRKRMFRERQRFVRMAVDPDWHPTSRGRPSSSSEHKVTRSHLTWQMSALQNEVLGQPAIGLRQQQSGPLDLLTKAAQAKEKAAVARATAASKVERCHKLFLKFDSALKKAVTTVIELEAIQATEQAAGEHDPGSNFASMGTNGLEMLKQRVHLLSNQVASGLGEQGQLVFRSGEEVSHPQFGSWPVYSEFEEGFNGDIVTLLPDVKEAHPKQALLSDADVTLLPVASWSQELDAGLGTTLLQRVEKTNELSQGVI